MSSKNDLVRVVCAIDDEKETPKAMFIAQEDEDDPECEFTYWIPKSQVDRIERGSSEYTDQIWIPRWLAESKEGLEFDDE